MYIEYLEAQWFKDTWSTYSMTSEVRKGFTYVCNIVTSQAHDGWDTKRRIAYKQATASIFASIDVKLLRRHNLKTMYYYKWLWLQVPVYQCGLIIIKETCLVTLESIEIILKYTNWVSINNTIRQTMPIGYNTISKILFTHITMNVLFKYLKIYGLWWRNYLIKLSQSKWQAMWESHKPDRSYITP